MYIQKRKVSLWFNDFVYDGKDIIFMAGNFNGLFRADAQSGEASLIGTVPEEDFFSCHLFSGMYKCGNYILLIPAWSKNFYIYDMESQTFRKILTDMNLFPKEATKYSFAFYASILQGKYVYVFGYDQPEIVRIDMETLKVIRYEGWLDKLYVLGKRENAPFFYKDICVCRDSLFLVTGQNNSIIELNMGTDQIGIHPIGEKDNIYNTIAYDGKYFWLTKQTNEILRVDSNNWEFQYKRMNQCIHTDYFLCSAFNNGKVWLFSNRSEEIYQIDCMNGIFDKFEVIFAESDEWYPSKKGYGYWLAKTISNGRLVVFSAEDCQMHVFESGKETSRIKFFSHDSTIAMKLYKENGFWFWKDAKYIEEKDMIFYHLEDLIYFSENFQRGKQKTIVDYGAVIYQSVGG